MTRSGSVNMFRTSWYCCAETNVARFDPQAIQAAKSAVFAIAWLNPSAAWRVKVVGRVANSDVCF
jgi:hypothetical protein